MSLNSKKYKKTFNFLLNQTEPDTTRVSIHFCTCSTHQSLTENHLTLDTRHSKQIESGWTVGGKRIGKAKNAGKRSREMWGISFPFISGPCKKFPGTTCRTGMYLSHFSNCVLSVKFHTYWTPTLKKYKAQRTITSTLPGPWKTPTRYAAP